MRNRIAQIRAVPRDAPIATPTMAPVERKLEDDEDRAADEADDDDDDDDDTEEEPSVPLMRPIEVNVIGGELPLEP